MNKEQLSSVVIAEEIHKSKWQAQESAKYRAAAAHNAQVLAPFEKLEARSAEVRMAFRELIRDGQVYREPYWDNHAKKGVVVVLDKAPVSPVTPDHTAVCLLEYRLFVPSVQVGPRGDFGHGDSSFKFAMIPSSSVGDVLASDGYPFAKIPEDELIISREYLPKQSDIKGRGHRYTYDGGYVKKAPSQRGYERAVQETESDVFAIESSLAMVLQAIADPDLNPHLHQEPRTRFPSEDDQYFVRPE